ncbi:single-strand binding protein [Rhizobium subbaraonis]|uniref:Single-stranded DNA-binding protein n=1 Tax=Rhizobium subbaraonis TaxID=908946 RepID=A0A285U5D2_9HYPH|nr:single-stranded DNA-binding protein [Rhizobium subbaraonis]SOC37042.1 single-strand binding protein [Rhizobium subbaraonis]
MAGSVNKVVLVGRVGADPDYHRFQHGELVDFSLATSETWRDRTTGERKEKTQWHKVKVSAEGLVKIAKDFIRKGSHVYVEGMVEYESWEKDGERKYATKIHVKAFHGSIQLLDKRDGDNGGERRQSDSRGSSSGGRSANSGGSSNYGGSGGSPGRGSSFSRDLDDDIPFAPEWR